MKHLRTYDKSLVLSSSDEKKFKEWQERNKPKPPKGGPQLGDWVICDRQENNLNTDIYSDEEIEIYSNYMKSTIGKIVKVRLFDEWYFDIFFDNFPKELSGFFNPVSWTKDFISFHSQNREDCEVIIKAKKYNI